MAGLDALRLLKAELVEAGAQLDVERFQQEAHVVAQVDPLEHLTHEPIGDIVEQRHSPGTLVPGDPLELVHLVAVSPPKCSASSRSRGSSLRKWTASSPASHATGKVWFFREMQ